jgi:hypothetical protein
MKIHHMAIRKTDRACKLILNLELITTMAQLATNPSCYAQTHTPAIYHAVDLPLPPRKASLPSPLFLLLRRGDLLQQQQHFLIIIIIPNVQAPGITTNPLKTRPRNQRPPVVLDIPTSKSNIGHRHNNPRRKQMNPTLQSVNRLSWGISDRERREDMSAMLDNTRSI